MSPGITDRTADDAMSLVKVRRAAQITLPLSVRKALKVREGDYLEAEIVEGGVLLRPVAVIDRAAALDRLARMLEVDRVQELSEEEVMREAVQEVKAVRRARREGRP